MAQSKYILSIVFLLYFNTVCGQKENNIWILGSEGNGFDFELNFSTGAPDTATVLSQLSFFNADVSICDSLGQILFYSNGINIYNKNFDSLFNTSGFNPGWATNFYANSGSGLVQPMVIVTSPGQNKYLIFHESAEYLLNGETQPMNLSYSEIDMNLAGGLGGITSRKNIHIIDDTLVFGKITACRNANGRDWWVIAHKYNSDLYYKVLVLPDTMIVSQQNVGSIIPDVSDGYGQISFSPDGEKLIFACQNNNIDILGFDRCNGNLSFLETVSTPDTSIGISGCSISPSSRFLYVNNEINLYQFDLNSSNIGLSRYWVATWDSFIDGLQTYFFINQLANNNKIYLSTFNGTSYLHIIDQPDQQGTACNFIQHGLKLPMSNIGLPSFPNYHLGPLIGSICDTLHIGINEFNKRQKTFSVSPNPASGSALFQYDLSFYNKAELFICDALGRTKKYILDTNQKNQKINTSELANGIYYCRLIADDLLIGDIKLSIIK